MSNENETLTTSDPASCPDCGNSIPEGGPQGLCPACLAGMFFGAEGAEPMSMDEPVREAGDVIGRYRLIEPLGEGGFGIVYRAHQELPFQRDVALKLIKPGLDSRMVVARFEAERQALSMLDHPHIARVLDAGTTTDGRPFFVMDLVEGLPVTQFCEQNRLTLEERLTLFQDICSGMEHAHAKGVIHRDVKPSNVMVTAGQDGQPPKVTIIDFGIAKALWQELTPHTLYTHPRQMMGTPEYMSPEQALNGGLDIDTRADVYSLGALLYEMLTGHPPLSDDTLHQKGLDQWLRIIQEVVPTRPSRKLSTLASETTLPYSLRRRIENELDWVVLKALSKERERRYQTVRELNEDVRCFLHHEAVSARPPSLSYLARKFIRRHRAQVMLAAAAICILIVGSIVSLSLALRAEAAEERTRQAFSQADLSVAHEKAQGARYGEAVALLCRALRLNGKNQEAAFRLLTLLAEAPVGVMASPALTHPEPVSQGQFLPPDGRQILTASNDSTTLTLWDWQPQHVQRLRRFVTHSPLGAYAVSPDGQWVAYGDLTESQSEVRVCSIQDGSLRGQPLILTHSNQPSSPNHPALLAIAFSPDAKALYAAATDNKLRAWNVDEASLLWEAPTTATPRCLEVSSDGQRLAVGIDARLALYDATSGAVVRDATVQRHRVEGVKFSPDGKKVMVTGGDTFATTLDSRTGQKHGDLQHFERIHTLVVTADSQRVATGGVDGFVRLRSLKGAFIRAERLPDAVRTLAFSADATKLAAGSLEPHAVLAVLDGRTGEPCGPPLQLHRTATDFSFHPNNQYLLVNNQSEQAIVFDTRPRRLEVQTFSLGETLLHAGFLPAGDLFALTDTGALIRRDLTGSPPSAPPLKNIVGRPSAFAFNDSKGVVAVGQKLWMIDLTSWQIAAPLTLPSAPTKLVLTSQHHHLLTWDSRAQQLRLYSFGTQQESFSWTSDIGPVLAMTCSEDGRLIVTGHEKGELMFHHTASGESHRVQSRSQHPILSLTLDPNATRLVAGSPDAQLAVWDVATESEVPSALTSPPRHADSAMSGGLQTLISHSADLFFSYHSHDSRVRSFRCQTGAANGPALMHRSVVNQITQSPDGSLLLTAEASGHLNLWHLASHLPAAASQSVSGEVIRLAFSHHGRLALAATRQGQLHLWHLPPATGLALPEEFLRFAEGFGRWQLTSANVLADVPYEVFQSAREHILALPDDPKDPQRRWMKWLAADPEQRPSWPEAN